MIQTTTLKLPKIGCQGCMKKVVNALNGLEEVEIVETDVPTKTVSLRYDADQVALDQIEGALHAIGHVAIEKLA